MKVLYIASEVPDYLQNIVFTGLCKVLGKENVLDFPERRHLHEEGKWPNSWIGGSRATFKPSEADCVILAACKDDAYGAFQAIAGDMDKPKVFIDGGDSSVVGGDLYVFKGDFRESFFDLIYKRESLSVDDPYIYLPFGINFDMFPPFDYVSKPVKKDIDISFCGRLYGIRSPNRYWYVNEFVDVMYFSNELSKEEYFDIIRRSWLCLGVRGAGWDCIRTWEILAIGSVLFSEVMPIRVQADFMHGFEVVYFHPGAKSARESFDSWIGKKERLSEIALRGHKEARDHHTDVCRAKKIIDGLELLAQSADSLEIKKALESA